MCNVAIFTNISKTLEYFTNCMFIYTTLNNK